MGPRRGRLDTGGERGDVSVDYSRRLSHHLSDFIHNTRYHASFQQGQMPEKTASSREIVRLESGLGIEQ